LSFFSNNFLILSLEEKPLSITPTPFTGISSIVFFPSLASHVLDQNCSQSPTSVVILFIPQNNFT
jgi:hypothetical protein